MVRRILRAILIVLIVYIAMKNSSIGWRFWSKQFTSDTEENVQLLENLKRHVYKLSYEIGDRHIYRYEELNKAVGYISKEFRSFGYNVEFQEYEAYDEIVKNIIVTKIGAKMPEETVIIGAHYDTCYNPGADDNASAVAGLLEIARIMFDKKTDRSIKFIAFVNEEPPFFTTELMGSVVYAKDAKAREENIKGAIILEMIGYYSDMPHSQQYPPIMGMFYPNKGNFIAVAGNVHSRRLVKEVLLHFKHGTQFPIESIIAFKLIPGADLSDNWSFWQEGYPAVMITDTSFYRNPNYHTELDTYETLNYESMAEVVNGLSAVLAGLAE